VDRRRPHPDNTRLRHGDFSLDQVIIGPDGGLGFIDWDRAGVGNPAADLASAAASGLSHETMQHLLGGYTRIGPLRQTSPGAPLRPACSASPNLLDEAPEGRLAHPSPTHPASPGPAAHRHPHEPRGTLADQRDHPLGPRATGFTHRAEPASGVNRGLGQGSRECAEQVLEQADI
jgi:hypothetical protein